MVTALAGDPGGVRQREKDTNLQPPGLGARRSAFELPRCGASGIRTHRLLHAMQALSRMSYSPVCRQLLLISPSGLQQQAGEHVRCVGASCIFVTGPPIRVGVTDGVPRGTRTPDFQRVMLALCH